MIHEHKSRVYRRLTINRKQRYICNSDHRSSYVRSGVRSDTTFQSDAQLSLFMVFRYVIKVGWQTAFYSAQWDSQISTAASVAFLVKRFSWRTFLFV